MSWWHVFADCAFLALAFLTAHALRFSSGWISAPLGRIPLSDWMLLAALTIPIWLLINALHGLYYARLKQAFSAELGALTHSVAEGLLATILLTFAVRGLPDSRLALLLTVALAWGWLAGYRALARRMRRQSPRAVVVGDSPLAGYLRRQFAGKATRFELAAAYEQAADFTPDGADAVFCDSDQASGLWAALDQAPVRPDVFLLPGGDAAATAGLSVATVEGIPTLSVKSTADLEMMRRVKRVIDIIGSLTLIILTAPIWLTAMLGIALSMPGPLFFSHTRLGLNGKLFKLLKFRSMVKDAHKVKVDLAGFDDKYKLKNDPRITPFGKILRKTSLDELPQLVNILKGELSLVGPRPIVEDEVRKYGEWGKLLLTVPPGLTGMWQVSGRSDTTYQQRVDFDLYYINNWSLGLDLLIMLRTIPAVLSRKGAY